MTVSEHAEKFRYLSPESSNDPGKYRIERAAYQREPMDAFNDPRIRSVTLMFASRTGKTTILENRIDQKVDQEGGNILIILPTDKKGKKWSKINLGPMIRDNPHLLEKFADQKVRSKDNEILFKPFMGGVLVIGGANVPGSLSSWSMEEVMFDEIDEYPISADREGDPIELGMQRAENFLNKKFAFASTPTIHDASRIEEAWNESDQRMYFVPCPYCGAMQILIFSPSSMFSKYTKGYLKFLHKGYEVTYVAYECNECKKDILPKYKHSMVRNGVWRKMKPEVTNHAGFQINRLYSPWVPWKEMAENFLRAEKRPERYMVFVNKACGELYFETINYKYDEDEFLKRREQYEDIPNGVVVMTAGVDVQDDRLEPYILGWGRNEECWLIDKDVIKGSVEDDMTWTMLDEFILKQRKYENGFLSRYGKVGGILAVGVDTGDGEHSNIVNKYVQQRRKNRFFAIKGASKPQKDFVIFTKTKKRRNFLLHVDTFQGKKKIYYRLKVEQQYDSQARMKPTPMRMHFNMKCDAEFFQQLTSNQLKWKLVNGHKHQVFILPSGKRDEVLDGYDYALAVLHAITPGGTKNVDAFLDKLGDNLEFQMQEMQLDTPTPIETTSEETAEDQQPTATEELTTAPQKTTIPTIRIKI